MYSIDIDMKPPIAESMEALNEPLPKYFASLSLHSKKIKEGHFHEISFDGRGLALNPLRSRTQGLLPPNHVIEQLLL